MNHNNQLDPNQQDSGPFSSENRPFTVVMMILVGIFALKVLFNSYGFDSKAHPILAANLELLKNYWFLGLLYFGVCYALAQKTDTAALSASMIFYGILAIGAILLLKSTEVLLSQTFDRFSSSFNL